jgi:DNA-directed RNA polymerase specialized sigma subunit
MSKLKTDLELINEIKKGINSSENYEIISERHSPIYYYIVNKFVSDKNKEKKLDFLGDKDYYMFMAISEFDKSKKTKFSTYLANKIKWMCINDYHKTRKRGTINEENQKIDASMPRQEGFHGLKNEPKENEVERFFALAQKDSDKRIFKIFSLRYLKGKGNKLMPWRDVCKEEGVNLSIQGCINIHNQFIKKIKSKMEN